ncbi:MAG TPA: methylated-DNA--[protein]-cysteine S-methyltransferase [Phycisphaerae bacterium]|nr:methylated-DNA--[protein]-cysteine S-methyltransferase [Phycisphaerae bacterium]
MFRTTALGYPQGMLEYFVTAAPIGSVVVIAEDNTVLRHIYMTARAPDRARAWIARLHPDARYAPRLLPGFQKQLRDYFAGKPVRFDVDIDLGNVSEFRRKVLTACAQLDYGQTATYGELAQRIGKPLASRAVGAALGQNRLPLVIPCHRVVGCNGSLGGFSAEQGIAVKRWLLDLEAGKRRATL